MRSSRSVLLRWHQPTDKQDFRGLRPLADPAPPARKRVVFVVYGKKLTRSLPPRFVFYQHNAKTATVIPGAKARSPSSLQKPPRPDLE